MKYIVRCRVSGGVTGTRESVVKGTNGTPLAFATREEAEAHAQRILERLRGAPTSTRFQYWTEEANHA